MAVMQNSIIFGGVDSADFGIYIGGEGTFNAPKRDVEMISIPGRNGAFALDKGRFENIEVTYSAFNHEPDLATFSAQLEGFRNAICSQKGYQRLSDTFHPDEYRMAAYIDGLEIKPIEYNTAATFDIKFDCKPQRYLLDGEEAIDVTSGEVILNPTLFESSPMLEVEGYGTIGFNGYEIELNNETLGDVTVLSNSTHATRSKSFIFPSVLYNSGDTITVKNALFRWIVTHNESSSYTLVDFVSASDSLTSAKTRIVSRTPSPYSGHYETSYLSTAFESVTFTAGTTSTLTDNVSAVFTIYNQSNLQFVENTTVTATWTIKYEVYDAENDMITLTWTSTDTSRASAFLDRPSLYSGSVVASSSISMLGHPTYIDCDLGECYRIDDDEYISLNHKVDLGSDLPKLASGANTITADNTVTDLKVVPRWWKI